MVIIGDVSVEQSVELLRVLDRLWGLGEKLGTVNLAGEFECGVLGGVWGGVWCRNTGADSDNDGIEVVAIGSCGGTISSSRRVGNEWEAL